MIEKQVRLESLITPAALRRAGKKSFPILSMTMHGGLVDQAGKFKKRIASADTSPYKVVRRNQLVVGFPIDEGVLSFQNLYDEAIVSPAYDIWDLTNDESIDTRYFEKFLRSPRALAFYAAKLRGTTARRRTLPDDIFLSLPVPLPKLAEQRRIAEILDRAEALRAKRRSALAQLDTLTQSIFLDLFGDPATNPKSWSVRQLGELGAGIGAIVDGPFGSAINVKEDYVDDGEIPVIRTKNVRPFEFLTDDLKRITRAKFKGLERSSVVPGDIILTKVGTIGNVCFFPPSFEVGVLSTTGSCRIRPDEKVVRKVYLAYFLHLYRGEMMKLVAEGVQPFLNMSHIKSFRVPLPELKLQDEFSHRITVIEKFRTSQRCSLKEFDALFAVIQHRAFRGEL